MYDLEIASNGKCYSWQAHVHPGLYASWRLHRIDMPKILARTLFKQQVLLQDAVPFIFDSEKNVSMYFGDKPPYKSKVVKTDDGLNISVHKFAVARGGHVVYWTMRDLQASLGLNFAKEHESRWLCHNMFLGSSTSTSSSTRRSWSSRRLGA